MKDALGDKVTDVKLTQRLKSHPVCLTSKGGLSIEMEKVLNSMPTDQKVQAERVLEINAQHPILETLQEKYAADKDSIAENMRNCCTIRHCLSKGCRSTIRWHSPMQCAS